MLEVKNPIPNEVFIGRFPIRIFCDNGKTVCSHCQSTDHLAFRCPSRPKTQRKCFICGQEDHLRSECPKQMPCTKCGRDDHKVENCQEHSPNIRREESGPFTYNGSRYTDIIPFRGEQSCPTSFQLVVEYSLRQVRTNL